MCSALYCENRADGQQTPIISTEPRACHEFPQACSCNCQEVVRTVEQWSFVFKCRMWSVTWQSWCTLSWCCGSRAGKVSLCGLIIFTTAKGDALDCEWVDVRLSYLNVWWHNRVHKILSYWWVMNKRQKYITIMYGVFILIHLLPPWFKIYTECLIEKLVSLLIIGFINIKNRQHSSTWNQQQILKMLSRLQFLHQHNKMFLKENNSIFQLAVFPINVAILTLLTSFVKFQWNKDKTGNMPYSITAWYIFRELNILCTQKKIV